MASSNQECLSVFNRCGIHAVCATFLNLLSQLGPPPPLHQHVKQVKGHVSVRVSERESENTGNKSMFSEIILYFFLCVQVIESRQTTAPHLLPENVFCEEPR